MMKRKILGFALILVLILTVSVPAYCNEETETPFDISMGNGEHITAAVLVENGVAKALTENEYLELTKEYVAENNNRLENDAVVAANILEPKATYTFTPTAKMLAYAGARRVSPIYTNATSLSVTTTTTFTRTATETGGVSVTAGISSVVDAKVSSTYNLSVSATSSKSSSVTGTFKPSGKYTYSAVVFSPRIAIVKGSLKSGSKEYDMTWHYPVKGSSGILDGVYAISESDNISRFPDLG